MECKKCHRSFPSSIVIDGKRRNLRKRKFCLDCSPFGQGNHKDLTISDEERKRRKLENRRKRTNKSIRKRTKEIKEQLVEYKGGKCKICGYNKCIAALHFHHKNPQHKEFALSKLPTFNINTLKIEVDKCELVCANCHAELHSAPSALLL